MGTPDSQIERVDESSVKHRDSISSDVLVPPDGGFGWVVVFAAFLCAFFIDGITNSFGIFYMDFVDYYESDKALTALAGSLICGGFLTFGAISGPLVTRFGCRPVAFVGGLVTSAALIFCTFSPNIEIFLMTYGVLAGLGLGLVYVPSMLIVNFYFDKKRGLASGMVTSGAGVGVVVLAKLSEALLKEYGWKGAHMVIAGLALHLCVCAALFRPLKVNSRCYNDPDSCESFEVEDGETAVAQTLFPMITTNNPILSNCRLSSPYVSLSMVEEQSKSQYLRAFTSRLQPHSCITPISGRPGCRSTEGLNRLGIKKYGPGRLSSSMYAVYTDTETLNDNVKQPQKYKQRKTVETNPLSRKDIYFSGSVMSLARFKSQGDPKHYIAGVTLDGKGDMANQNDLELAPSGHNKSTCANVDLSLFKNLVFNIFCVSSMLIQFASFIPAFYLGNFSMTLGLGNSSTSTFLACIGFCCIIGRLSSGAMASWIPSQSIHIMAVSLILTGVCCALYPACTTFLQVAIVSCLFGFFVGFFPPLQPVLLVKYLGLEKLSTSFGLSTGLKGIATMVGPPIAGVLLESTGTFLAPFFFGGACFVLSAFMHWLIPFFETSNTLKTEMSLEVASSDSGSQTEESAIDSDEEKSAKESLNRNEFRV